MHAQSLFHRGMERSILKENEPREEILATSIGRNDAMTFMCPKNISKSAMTLEPLGINCQHSCVNSLILRCAWHGFHAFTRLCLGS